MSTASKLQDRLAELRMVMDRDNPVHCGAEAAFAATVAKLVRKLEVTENICQWRADEIAERMMLGTAEGYDGMCRHIEP